METMTVNGRTFSVKKLLGKGKGGYSYLVSDETGEYVLKQIHHEPCDYYQFGDKLASELRDYERLTQIGIPMPKLLDVDRQQERLLKEYIPGDTIDVLVKEGRMEDGFFWQMEDMCRLLYPANTNIDYFPTNFVVCGGSCGMWTMSATSIWSSGISKTGAANTGGCRRNSGHIFRCKRWKTNDAD